MAYGAHIARRGPKDGAFRLGERGSQPRKRAEAVGWSSVDFNSKRRSQGACPWDVAFAIMSETHLERSVGVGTMST